MSKILVIDNYDSFTYNLVSYIKTASGQIPDVFRNDKITPEECMTYDKILLSPGPGVPEDAGNLKAIIKQCAPTKSMLGVCLGLQAIAEVFQGKIINLKKVYHGISTPINLTSNKDTLFNGLPQVFEGARYHSWIVDKNKLPDSLSITASDPEGQIMALKHSQYDVKGVQFHPESILTEYGGMIIKNWIKN